LRVVDAARTTREKAQLASELRASAYSIAADLGWKSASGLDGTEWLEASGARTRIGWLAPGTALEGSGFDFAVPDTRFRAEMHWSESLLEPFAPYGVFEPVHAAEPFRLPPRALRVAERRWPPGKKRLLIVPGSAAPKKNWPKERFAEVARWARLELDASVLTLGAPWESDLIASVGEVAYTGRSLALAAALVQTADLVLANDTGPTHLAFAMGRPTIALYSTMPPEVWGPGRRDSRFVVLCTKAKGEWDAPVWLEVVKAHVARVLASRS
jgi:ADP-heptose:LPS heptosyltransferase